MTRGSLDETESLERLSLRDHAAYVEPFAQPTDCGKRIQPRV